MEELNAQINYKLCNTCTAIPFDKLPHEEDPAYPHKQSLSDLEESSKVCKLCELILSAIEDAQEDFDFENYDIADTIKLEKYNYDKVYATDRLASKKFAVYQILARVPGVEISLITLRSHSKHSGAETEIGFSGPPAPSNELVLRTEMQKDLSNRVWLYGNWWTLLGANQYSYPLQLIGFGARLTRNPRMRISNASRERRNILYRGSDIRGDKNDWERESTRMCEVYENSYLTIAASVSTGPDCGFLSPQRSLTYISPDSLSTGFNEIRTQNCKVQYCPTGSQPSVLYFTKEWMPTSFRDNPRTYQIGCFGAAVDPLDKEPLNKRGWVLQERYLSSRIVHYGKHQLFFECNGGMIAEDGSRFERPSSKNSLLSYRNITSSYWSNNILTSKGLGRSLIDVQIMQRCRNGWPNVVEEFSRRKLSVESDKLPALSGLARFLARETNDIYLAGIWKQHVFQDLLWRVSPYDDDTTYWINKDYIRMGESIKSCKRPSTVTPLSSYRAPTWSWAALDGPVKFELPSKVPQHALLCDYSIKQTTIDIFGTIKYGKLKIKAPFF
ncbi:hypothetical protein B7463_g9194, partial [Scytalidium lignicola]